MSGLLIATWIVSGIVALMYLMAGGLKLNDPAKVQQMGATAAAQSTNSLRFIGAAEVLGALGVVLPAVTQILPWLSGLAAAALALVQGLAIQQHVKHKDTDRIALNVGLLVAAGFVAVARLAIL